MPSRWASVLLATALLLDGTAFGDSTAASLTQTQFQLGVDLYREGQFEEVLSHFQRAYHQRPLPRLELIIIRVRMKLERDRKAGSLFKRCLGEELAKTRTAQRRHRGLDFRNNKIWRRRLQQALLTEIGFRRGTAQRESRRTCR